MFDSAENSPAIVAILLGAYNGQDFIREQLESFAVQTHGNWHIYVSDDGSTDGTKTVLDSFSRQYPGRLTQLKGPKKGFSENFLSLICNPEIKGDYFAFSDQDDVCEPDKLSRAAAWLGSVPGNVPALYCSCTLLIDGAGQELGISPMPKRPTGFANALVQNIAPGNTMVFNQATLNLLREGGTGLNLAFHDWWAYMAVTGCGGRVFMDPVPTMRYRQHGNNIIGSNSGLMAKYIRFKKLLSGHMQYWNTQNIKALGRIRHRITPENLVILDRFSSARHHFLIKGFTEMKRSGIYRQTGLGNTALIIAAFLRKL